MTETQRSNEMEIAASIEELFDIAHEDKQFYIYRDKEESDRCEGLTKNLWKENS